MFKQTVSIICICIYIGWQDDCPIVAFTAADWDFAFVAFFITFMAFMAFLAFIPFMAILLQTGGGRVLDGAEASRGMDGQP